MLLTEIIILLKLCRKFYTDKILIKPRIHIEPGLEFLIVRIAMFRALYAILFFR